MMNPFRRIAKTRTRLHEQGFHGAEAFRVFLDMRYCKRKFHCTYEEYFRYSFYNLKNRIRKNYLLRYHALATYDLVNTGTKKIYGKDQVYELFSDKIHRQWMRVTPDNMAEVESFIRKHGKVIFKPNFGKMGTGVFAMTADEIEEQLTQKLAQIAAKCYLCEQYVVQHPKLAEMNPSSVNTVRITTLCDGKSVKMVFGSLRTGGKGSVCDNMSGGGVGTVLDMEAGISISTGIDLKNNRYYHHPATGTKMIGFEIPFWTEIREMLTECALRFPESAILGWDIAVTETGPCIIEVNSHPAAGTSAQVATGQPVGEEIIRYINSNWRKYHKNMPKKIKKNMKRFG